MISRKPRRPRIGVVGNGEGSRALKARDAGKSFSSPEEDKDRPFGEKPDSSIGGSGFFVEETSADLDNTVPRKIIFLAGDKDWVSKPADSHLAAEHLAARDHFVVETPVPQNIIAFPQSKRSSRQKKYIIGVGAAVFALVMVILVYSPLLGLKTIRVTGLKLITEEQIDEALSPLKNMPLPQVTDQSVKDLLGPVVALKDVAVYRQPPHGIELRIQERVPAAVIRNNSGFVLVDVDGVQLSMVADRTGIDLPLIDGGSAVGHDIFKVIMTVLSELPEEIVKQTDYVRANTVSTVELVLKDGKVVVWGDAKQGNIKSRALSILLADPRVRAEARTVDVSAPHIPVTKK